MYFIVHAAFVRIKLMMMMIARCTNVGLSRDPTTGFPAELNFITLFDSSYFSAESLPEAEGYLRPTQKPGISPTSCRFHLSPVHTTSVQGP